MLNRTRAYRHRMIRFETNNSFFDSKQGHIPPDGPRHASFADSPIHWSFFTLRRLSMRSQAQSFLGFGLVLLALATGACSGPDSGPSSSSSDLAAADLASTAADLATSPGSDGGAQNPNTTADALTAFVKGGSYKTWKAEPAIHASTGPHGGNVRTYVNDVLYASLKAGSTSHPKGSIVVKELYGSGTSTLTGHAIDIKDDQSSEWVFYEGFAPGYSSPYYYRGTANFCANCHAPGLDYVLTKPSALP